MAQLSLLSYKAWKVLSLQAGRQAGWQLLVGSAGILKGSVSSSLTLWPCVRGGPVTTGGLGTYKEAALNFFCIIINCGDSGLVQCHLWNFSEMGYVSLAPLCCENTYKCMWHPGPQMRLGVGGGRKDGKPATPKERLPTSQACLSKI